MAKYIFVTGGVVSGLGKGITAASLGQRDRPRPRALRALHRRGPQPLFQPHDRQGLLERAEQGAPRGIPGPDRAGHPAHHAGDQGLHLFAGEKDRRGRDHHRDRRHDRRHREPALPRGGAAGRARAGAGEHALHPRDARALPARQRRAQDQAHAALGQGAAGHGHRAGHHRAALRRAAPSSTRRR